MLHCCSLGPGDTKVTKMSLHEACARTLCQGMVYQLYAQLNLKHPLWQSHGACYIRSSGECGRCIWYNSLSLSCLQLVLLGNIIKVAAGTAGMDLNDPRGLIRTSISHSSQIKDGWMCVYTACIACVSKAPTRMSGYKAKACNQSSARAQITYTCGATQW